MASVTLYRIADDEGYGPHAGSVCREDVGERSTKPFQLGIVLTRSVPSVWHDVNGFEEGVHYCAFTWEQLWAAYERVIDSSDENCDVLRGQVGFSPNIDEIDRWMVELLERHTWVFEVEEEMVLIGEKQAAFVLPAVEV